MSDPAFMPVTGVSTLKVTAGTTAAGGSLPAKGGQVRIYNASSSLAFVRFGVGAQTAVSTDTPVPPGVIEVLSVGETADNVSVLLASGSGDVYVTSGKGV